MNPSEAEVCLKDGFWKSQKEELGKPYVALTRRNVSSFGSESKSAPVLVRHFVQREQGVQLEMKKLFDWEPRKVSTFSLLIPQGPLSDNVNSGCLCRSKIMRTNAFTVLHSMYVHLHSPYRGPQEGLRIRRLQEV
jgi:hypothetical protein